MQRQLFNRVSSFALTIFLSFCAFSVYGQQSLQFSVTANASTDPLQGQIDWPGGKLESWDGPVVLFISAAAPSDRDGWEVRALETVWAERLPLKELSAELVKQGVAVIRFDNPGVLAPHKQCRKSIFKRGLTERVLWQRCLDLEVVGRYTPGRYWENIEHMLPQVQDLIPAMRTNLFLFGFSEGLMHAAALADRGSVKPQGLISIGSPAERFDTLSRWQGTGRVMETLDEFDTNLDGIVTNEEIRLGYGNGVNRFMSLSGWLSGDGYWDSQNRHLLADFVDRTYEQILRDFSDVSGPGRLDWKAQANGVQVPDMTEAVWRLHFYGQTSPAEVMQRREIPGLFMWGEKDRQVGVARQVALIDKARSEGADIAYRRYPGRHHLLSKRKDFDWLEKDFMPIIAKEVVGFLENRLRPSQTAAHSLIDTGEQRLAKSQ